MIFQLSAAPARRFASGIRTQIALIKLGTALGIGFLASLETDALPNACASSSTPARAPRALLTAHHSFSKVPVPQGLLRLFDSKAEHGNS